MPNIRRDASRGISIWTFLLLILLPLAALVFVYLWGERRRRAGETPAPGGFKLRLPKEAETTEAAAPGMVSAEPARRVKGTVAAPAGDDLKVIEGIGPKISAVLQAAGVQSFQQLADTPVERLREMLVNAGIRIAVPDTWPEQARLAAGGLWDELAQFQSRLRGGRRVA